MPLDPQFRTILDHLEDQGLLPLVRDDAEQTRAHYRALSFSLARRAVRTRTGRVGGGPAVAGRGAGAGLRAV